MIPIGTHKARCYDDSLVQFGRAANQTPQIAIPIEVTDGHAKGERGWFISSLGSDDAIAFTMKAMRTLGWENDDIGNPLGLQKNEVEIKVEEEEYQGKTRTRIRYINSLDRRFEFNATLEGNERIALSARLKAYAVKSRSEIPKGAPPARSSAADMQAGAAERAPGAPPQAPQGGGGKLPF